MKDAEMKEEFKKYLDEHPDERFWQALRNWSTHSFILVSDDLDILTNEFLDPIDTFYWEGRK